MYRVEITDWTLHTISSRVGGGNSRLCCHSEILLREVTFAMVGERLGTRGKGLASSLVGQS